MKEAGYNEYLLVKQLKADDPAAYKTLYEQYAPRLQAFSRRFRLSKEESDEIVQDTFVRIWLYRQKIDPEAGFSPFLITVARNLIYNHIRKNAQWEKYLREIDAGPAWEAAKDNELEQFLLKTIHELPDRCRQVFRKSRLEGYSNAQIAEEMNISKSTVENQLNKALKHIRKQLEMKGYWGLVYFFLFFLEIK